MADFTATVRKMVQAGKMYTLREVALLALLAEPEPVTVRGAAKTLNVNKPAVTRGMDFLVKEGLAARKDDKDDRRSVFLTLTAKGKKGRGFLGMTGGAVGELAAPLRETGLPAGGARA